MTNRNEDVLFSALAETRKVFEKQPEAAPLKLVQSKAEEVAFGADSKRKRKSWREKPVDSWTNSDLWYYFKARFFNKFGYAMNHALQPGRQGLLRMGEELKKVLGSWPSPAVCKSYLDWFMDDRLPDLVGKYSCFKLNFVYYPANIADFVADTGEKGIRSLQSSHGAEKKKVVFAGSLVDFACEQGLLLLFAYFSSQGKSEEEAAKLVATAVRMADKAGRYSEFAAATRDNGPYPRELELRNMERILSKIAELSGRRVSLLRLAFEDDAEPIEFRKET